MPNAAVPNAKMLEPTIFSVKAFHCAANDDKFIIVSLYKVSFSAVFSSLFLSICRTMA